MNYTCPAGVWIFTYFALCWFCLSGKLIRCSKARSAPPPSSIIFHNAWHDALQSEYSISADRQEAAEVRSVWPAGLSKVRKLLREGNRDAIFNPLKDEPGNPEWKLALRQGTKSGHQSHVARAQPSSHARQERLHHRICSRGLFLSESGQRQSELDELAWALSGPPPRDLSWKVWAFAKNQ